MSDRPDHAGLRHLALRVHDLDAMKSFYVDLLGFAIEWEPDADNVYLTSAIDNLALHRAPEMVIPVEADSRTLPPPGGGQAMPFAGRRSSGVGASRSRRSRGPTATAPDRATSAIRTATRSRSSTI